MSRRNLKERRCDECGKTATEDDVKRLGSLVPKFAGWIHVRSTGLRMRESKSRDFCCRSCLESWVKGGSDE